MVVAEANNVNSLGIYFLGSYFRYLSVLWRRFPGMLGTHKMSLEGTWLSLQGVLREILYCLELLYARFSGNQLCKLFM